MVIISSDKDLTFLDTIKYPEINIEEGEFVFISGKSGCGKSSYLRLLNRTAIPSSGNIYFKDANIDTFPVLDYRKLVLLVPQNPFLFEGTIRDNFNQYYDAIEKNHLTDDEIKNYLNISCVDFSPDDECKNFSGGEKQRVFLSIYLSCAEKVILLDEPASALDKETSEKLFSNLRDFCKDKHLTAVSVCHNNELVEKFGDRCIHFGGRNE